MVAADSPLRPAPLVTRALRVPRPAVLAILSLALGSIASCAGTQADAIVSGDPTTPSTPGTGTVTGATPSPGTPATPTPPGVDTVPAGPRIPVSLRYAIDRARVPQQVSFRDLTVRVYVGRVATVTADVDGQAAPVRYDTTSGWVRLTTTGTLVQLDLTSADTTIAQFGTVTKAVLRDDKRWAYSFGFDDNVSFKEHGIPFAESLGYRGTVFVMNKDDNSLFPLGKNESWILDEGDLPTLVKGGTIRDNNHTFTTTGGWAIGSHSWSHSTVAGLGSAAAAKADVLKMQDRLRAVLDRAGLQWYKVTAFASPMFDAAYQPIIDGIRTTEPSRQLLFHEGGSAPPLQVDGPFDPGTTVPRWNTFTFGNGGTDDPAVAVATFRRDTAHHYWLNTLDHGVDGDYPNGRFYKWLQHVRDTWGAGGTNDVWVAPSDRIVSYLLVRDHSVITRR